MRMVNLTRTAAAVGVVLALVAGTALAAAPVKRSPEPLLVSQVNGGVVDADIRSLLSSAGVVNESVRFVLTLDSAVVVTGNPGSVGVGTIGVTGVGTGVTQALVIGNATLANNHIVVYTGTTATQVPSTGATASLGITTGGKAPITVTLPAPGLTKAYRINSTGALEFSADTSIAAPVFAAVLVDVQVVVGAEIYTEVGGVAGFQAGDLALVASLAIPAHNSLAPVPIISTRAAAGGALVNGFAIDTGTPIALTAANLAVTTRTSAQVFPAASMTAPVCAASSCLVVFPGLGTVATAADFVAPVGTPDAADAAFYNSTNFNTGIIGITVPFKVDGVNAAKASYTQVFNVSDGLASKLADSAGLAAGDAAAFPLPATDPIADGAGITVLSAVSSTPVAGITNLTLTFSEPIVLLANGGTAPQRTLADLREVTEHVLAGSDSLAALNLNSGGTLALTGPGVVAGQGTLTITGILATDIASKTLTVDTGIGLQEVNDVGFSATAATLDADSLGAASSFGPDGVPLAGGVAAANATSVTNTIALRAPSSAAAITVTAAPLTIKFGGADTTAQAFTGADPTKVVTIDVVFAPGKEVALNQTAPAKTLTDLANNLVITVNGLAGITPVQFQFHPTAAQLAFNLTGGTLTITLPTALVYANIDVVTRMEVEYLAAGDTNVAATSLLVGKADATVVVRQDAIDQSTTVGTERVILPLAATKTTDTLITQNVFGTLTAPVGTNVNGSRVKAFLAKWVDKTSTTQTVTSLLSGNVTNANDRVGTNLAIEFVPGEVVALRNAIATMMNAATPAAPAIPGVSLASPAIAATPTTVYVKLVRSNDPTANASGGSTNGQVYLNGRAIMGSTYGGAKGVAVAAGDDLDPIYEVSLSPPNVFLQPAGGTPGRANVQVTGRLTGNIVVTFTTDTNPGGLLFIDRDGNTNATAAGAGTVGQAIVGTVNTVANSYSVLLGIDPGTAVDGSNTMNINGSNTPGTNFGAITGANAFIILVHEQPGSTGSPFTMLTSADPAAANFMPFKPNLLTNPAVGTHTTLLSTFANIRHLPLVPSNNWALYGEGSPARQSVPAGQTWTFPRGFVGIDVLGNPKSFWTGDTAEADMAMTMAANKIAVATEITPQGTTLSTIANPFGVPGAVAFGWSNDIPGVAGDELDVLQVAPAVTPKVGIGWSLVTVPGTPGGVGTLNTASVVDAIIRVGSQLDATSTPQQTWVKLTDGTPPTLVGGEAVFVFSKTGGNL